MTIKTTILPNSKAQFVQDHFTDFGCQIVCVSPISNYSVRVSISGDDESMKRLFNELDEL